MLGHRKWRNKQAFSDVLIVRSHVNAKRVLPQRLQLSADGERLVGRRKRQVFRHKAQHTCHLSAVELGRQQMRVPELQKNHFITAMSECNTKNLTMSMWTGGLKISS